MKCTWRWQNKYTYQIYQKKIIQYILYFPFCMNTPRWYISLLLWTFWYSALWIAVRWMVDAWMTPVQTVFARTWLAVIMMIILMTIFYPGWFMRMIRAPRRDIGMLLFKGIFWFWISATLFSYAVVHTTYFNATVMYAIPFVSLLWILFNKDKFTRKSFAILGMSVIGMILILVKNIETFTLWLWELLAWIAALFLSLSFISRKRFTDYMTSHEVTIWVAFFGMIIVYIVSLIQWTTSFGAPLFGMTLSELPWFYMILWGILIAFSGIFNNYGMKHVSDTQANILLNTEVFWGLVISLFMYSEIITISEWVWAGLIVLSSILLVLALKKWSDNGH